MLTLPLFEQDDPGILAVFTIFADQQVFLVGRQSIVAAAVPLGKLVAEVNILIPPELNSLSAGKGIGQIDQRAA